MASNYNRANRIFNGNLQPPTMPADLDITGLMNMINPVIDRDNQLKRKQFTDDRQWDRNAKLADIASSMQAQQKPPAVFPETKPNQKPNHVLNIMSPYEQATIDFKNRELDQKRSLGSEKLDVTREGQDQRMNLGTERNFIADFKAKNPGMKIQVSKGGNFVGFDPITGKVIDTGVSSGTMSERDKLDVTNAGDMAEITARGDIQKDIQDTRGQQGLAQVAARVAGQKDIQGTRGTQALEQIGARIAGDKDVQATRGEQSLAQIAARGNEQRTTQAARPVTGMQPTQAKVLESNTARQIINTRPDLAPFIKQNQDGTYTVEPPGEAGWLGNAKPTQAQFEEITKALYPKAGTTQPAKASTAQSANKIAPKAPAGWKYVPKAGGGWTAVEDK